MRSSNNKNRWYFILTVFVGILLIGTINVKAQNVSPAIMAQVNSELKKRGLTEAEVRVRLLQEGIDLENVPAEQLPSYQTRVLAVLDELEAEKKKPSVMTPATTNQIVPVSIPVSTPQEEVAEAKQQAVQQVVKKTDEGSSSIYGHSLFTNQTLDLFRTTDGAKAPDTYVLGAGDEIRITIFGASQTDIQQNIADDGSIQPSGVAKIFLKGLTLSQAREVIKDRLSTSYTFRSDQFAVTIVTARTIMVNVFGETNVTGGFTLSALNSVFNALSAAGGPTSIGSVRNIQLIRGEKRKNIDLYVFMNDPAEQFKFDLQNNDILFVPVAKLLVSIQGAVKRPMVYEMLPNETLTDLINYAGDVKKDVFPDFVQIKRYINGEERLLEWNLEEVRTGKVKVALENGDVVHIKSIGKPMDQYVDIEGSVYYPGRYDLSANPLLSNLLNNSKLTFQAKTDVLFIERIRPDETVEVITVPFPGAEGTADFKLQPRDHIRIMDQATYRDVATISVSGHVRVPFEKSFALSDRITINQAIELAGGLKNSAYPVGYIFRRNLFNPTEMQYIRIDLEASGQTELQPGDKLNIYDNTTYSNVGEVKVSGAVKNPLGLTYDASLTVRDMLTNAGGFIPGADFNRIEVFRMNLSPTEKVKLELITLEVDSSFQLVEPKNFILQPYDQIVVRMTPEFTTGRVVEISGQVQYPGVYVLTTKQTRLSDVIKMAGGLLEDADPYGSSLFRTYRNRGNISVGIQDAIRHSGNNSYNPIIFEGDVININRLENTVTILENGTRMAQYSIHPERNNRKNIVYKGAKSAAWYIRNCAGGFDKKADRNSVTVTLANDQMISTKHFLFLRNYPTVLPGSIISLQMKPPKEEKTVQERKPVDWNAIWSSTLSATTSAVTLFVLITQLGSSK